MVLAGVSGLSQEPYEARAARLQPEDIPPLIQKAQDGDLSSQVLLWLEILSRFKIRQVPRNGLSIHLPHRMLHSNHIAARRFRGTAGRVFGKFLVVDPEKKSTLFP